MSFKLAEAFVEVSAKSKGLYTGLNQMKTKVTSLFSGMARSASAILSPLGIGIGAAGVGGGITYAVKQWASFEEELRKLQFTMGGTSEEVRGFADRLREMSKASGESLGSLASSLDDIVNAGMEVEGSMKVVDAAMKTAVATFTDTNRVTQSLISVMQAYRIENENAEKVTDVLVQSTKNARANIDEMSVALGKLAPQAAISGLNLYDVSASLSTMTKQGYTFADSVGMMNSALAALFRIQNKVQRGTIELEVDISKERIANEGLLSVLRDLNSVSDTRLQKMFEEFSGYRSMSALIQNLTTYQEDYNSVMNSGGQTQTEYQNSMELTNRKFKVFMQQMVDIGRKVGEFLVDTWNAVQDDLRVIWEEISKVFATVWNNVIKNLGLSESEFGTFFDTVQTLWQNFMTVILGFDVILEQSLETFKAWGSKLADVFTKVVKVSGLQLDELRVKVIGSTTKAILEAEISATKLFYNLGLISKERMETHVADMKRAIEVGTQESEENLEGLAKRIKEEIGGISLTPPDVDYTKFEEKWDKLQEKMNEYMKNKERKGGDKEGLEGATNALLDLVFGGPQAPKLGAGGIADNAIQRALYTKLAPLGISGMGRFQMKTGAETILEKMHGVMLKMYREMRVGLFTGG